MPIVALAVRGTRDAMPSGSLMIRRVPIHVEVLQIFEPRRSAQTSAGDLRQQTRALIAAAVGEALHE
jgi:hypothetical protein